MQSQRRISQSYIGQVHKVLVSQYIINQAYGYISQQYKGRCVKTNKRGQVSPLLWPHQHSLTGM